ncbi:MAG: hypothetical protein RB191_05410 [Terriglobia bacterium]|nr:hypothetical protein [Terriglobia bacterium]
MTSETRTTIQLSDFKAIEFECAQCHSRIIRPITTWQTRLDCCPDCGVSWIHYRGTMDFFANMASQIAKISSIDNPENQAPFVARFEIAQPARKDQP